MTHEWSVREQVLDAAHRWPIPMLAFLIGSLLGWGLGMLFPGSYQAETSILVGYNADQIMTSPDDYKNWQIEQLNALTIADDVLAETLARLQQLDPGWAKTGIPGLREQLKARFRNTGKWDLTARDRDAQRAVQAAEAWSQVVLEKYHQAAENAAAAHWLDAQVQALAASQATLQSRQQQLPLAQKELDRLEAEVASISAGGPIPDLEEWRAWSLAAAVQAPDDAWKGLLNNFPLSDTPQDLIDWVDKGLLLIERDRATLPVQLAEISKNLAHLEAQRSQAMQASRGLSANLIIEKGPSAPLQVTHERPMAVAASVGGFLGLLLWVLGRLVRLGLGMGA